MVLSYGVVCMILSLGVLIEHRLVSDGQTDRPRAIEYNALSQRREVLTIITTRKHCVFDIVTNRSRQVTSARCSKLESVTTAKAPLLGGFFIRYLFFLSEGISFLSLYIFVMLLRRLRRFIPFQGYHSLYQTTSDHVRILTQVRDFAAYSVKSEQYKDRPY